MRIQSLSPSMALTYLKCNRQFYYQNVAKLPRLASPVLALGAAIHETFRENAWQKINSGMDLSEPLLKNFFAEDLEYREVDWSGQGLSTTKDQGVICVEEYRQKMAPKVQPAFVEYAFNMEVKNRDWGIAGKVDLITDKEVVIDHKTTKGRMKAPRVEHVFQLGVYALAVKQQAWGANVTARLDYYPRGKRDAYSHPVTFAPSLAKNVLTTFDQVAHGIQSEVWAANRTSNYLCKRRYCNYWNQCEIDCGGTVAE